jgi:1-pyrroline-5-carboxylate dehydrogenase
MQARAASRTLADLTVGPVLTWTTAAMMAHMEALLKLPGVCV